MNKNTTNSAIFNHTRNKFGKYQQKTCNSAEPAYSVPTSDAGWSSLVARRAHNPKVVGSNPAPATNPIRCHIGRV
ncbi:hypothetical protein XBJ1_3704 [Xenorhabdus bovienii SS-2004]|uniref:Uncharacterized protein n=1 Tax=Xenorhabdus bovienii (strain SS-2004) TaxID=406818 RepID=D3V593_XENBS|nr:hypothetical protein XBJ1_3704 [Xenorhabdus bovienii SS-2004]